ncbi:Retrovirus-related Pol polyprotein from transposon 17.6 [Trichinella nativa]|uniref:Retrovirus-related Pol polyprotein from transposon 17.6 n=1 Tax=Trichinella nativa TaxID=6335 RepID=A0A0V1LFK6_9BILA|nr:Retrovirus-related Pol polyprotein from transposon 17.6 [Trichinella nativa]
MYYRDARIAPERRASLVHYHTNEEVRGVMKALYVQETDDYDGLKSALFEAFGVRTGSEKFSAMFFRRKQQRGESMRDYAGHLRWLFPKAFPGLSEVATREKRVWRELTMLKASASSVKAIDDQEDLQLAVEVTEAAAPTVTTQNEVGEELAEVVRQLKKPLMTVIIAAAKRTPLQQRLRREKKDSRRCWTCGRTGHISRNCKAFPRDYRTSKIETLTVEGSVRGLRCNMLVCTGPELTIPDDKFMRGSKTLWDVLKPAIRLDTASGDELQVTNACVTKIILGGLVTVQHTVLWVKGLSHKILLEKSQAVVAVRAESPRPDRTAHSRLRKAIENASQEFADVLSTSDEVFMRTSVIRHTIHTGAAKPARRRGAVEQTLGVPYRPREEERLLVPVLRRPPVIEQSNPEGRPPAPEDRRHRLLVNGSAETGPGEDGLHHPLWPVPVQMMPFGLCKAPATFHRLMQMALRGLVESKCLVYLDDVIVFGKTAEQHTARLREVLRRLQEGDMKVKPEKRWLMKRKVAYLGHIISEKGISRLRNKTSTVREWPTLICVTEFRPFLWLASYYRKFVNGFANHVAPLHRLLAKGAEWDWSKACQSAFYAL